MTTVSTTKSKIKTTGVVDPSQNATKPKKGAKKDPLGPAALSDKITHEWEEMNGTKKEEATVDPLEEEVVPTHAIGAEPGMEPTMELEEENEEAEEEEVILEEEKTADPLLADPLPDPEPIPDDDNPDDDPDEPDRQPQPHWHQLYPGQLVAELGYDWKTVQGQFAAKNRSLTRLGDGNRTLNSFIKKSIIDGWRMGDPAPDHRSIEVSYDLAKRQYVIEAWSYDEAVAKARKIGLKETDTFYWKHKLSGKEEWHGLGKAHPTDWYNFEHVEYSDQLLIEMGFISDNMTLASVIAGIPQNRTLHPLFRQLVKEAQEAVNRYNPSDDPVLENGKLDEESRRLISITYYLRQKNMQGEVELAYEPDVSGVEFEGQESFEKYYEAFKEKSRRSAIEGATTIPFQELSDTQKALFVNQLNPENGDRDLFLAVQNLQSIYEEIENPESQKTREDYEYFIAQLERDIFFYAQVRYSKLNALVEAQKAVLNDTNSSEEDRAYARKQLAYYEQLRAPFIETDPVKITERMREESMDALAEDEEFASARQYMPPTVGPKLAFDIYYNTLVEEFLDLGYKYGYLTKDGWNDTSTLEKIGAMLGSTFNTLEDGEKRWLHLKFKIEQLQGAYLFNENPLAINPESTFGEVFLSSLAAVYMGETGSGLFATEQFTAQTTQSTIGEAGVSGAELTEDAENSVSNTAAGYEAFSARDWAQMLGTSVGFMSQFVGVGGAVGGGVRLLQGTRLGILLARTGGAARGIINMSRVGRVLANARLTRWLYAGLKSGAMYELTGEVFPNSEEEANFWAGFFGGLGGDAAKGLFMKIFGRFASEAVKTIVRLNGQAVGEVTEETIQTLLEIHKKSNSYGEMWDSIGQMFEAPEGGYSPAYKLFVQSYIMGLAFGTGSSVGMGMLNFAQKQQNELTTSEQTQAQELVAELNETYMLALESGLSNSEGTLDSEYETTTPRNTTVAETTPDGNAGGTYLEQIAFYLHLRAQGVTTVRHGDTEVNVEQMLELLLQSSSATEVSNAMNTFAELQQQQRNQARQDQEQAAQESFNATADRIGNRIKQLSGQLNMGIFLIDPILVAELVKLTVKGIRLGTLKLAGSKPYQAFIEFTNAEAPGLNLNLDPNETVEINGETLTVQEYVEQHIIAVAQQRAQLTNQLMEEYSDEGGAHQEVILEAVVQFGGNSVEAEAIVSLVTRGTVTSSQLQALQQSGNPLLVAAAEMHLAFNSVGVGAGLQQFYFSGKFKLLDGSTDQETQLRAMEQLTKLIHSGALSPKDLQFLAIESGTSPLLLDLLAGMNRIEGMHPDPGQSFTYEQQVELIFEEVRNNGSGSALLQELEAEAQAAIDAEAKRLEALKRMEELRENMPEGMIGAQGPANGGSYSTTDLHEDYQEDGIDYAMEQKVTYFESEAERARHEVFVVNGVLVDISGNRIDTLNAGEFDYVGEFKQTGKAIFVMDQNGRIFVEFKPQRGVFHHSTFLAGEEVAMAGEMQVVDGIITLVNNKSGHYVPLGSFLENMKIELSQRGVNVSGVNFIDVRR